VRKILSISLLLTPSFCRRIALPICASIYRAAVSVDMSFLNCPFDLLISPSIDGRFPMSSTLTGGVSAMPYDPTNKPVGCSPLSSAGASVMQVISSKSPDSLVTLKSPACIVLTSISWEKFNDIPFLSPAPSQMVEPDRFGNSSRP